MSQISLAIKNYIVVFNNSFSKFAHNHIMSHAQRYSWQAFECNRIRWTKGPILENKLNWLSQSVRQLCYQTNRHVKIITIVFFNQGLKSVLPTCFIPLLCRSSIKLGIFHSIPHYFVVKQKHCFSSYRVARYDYNDKTLTRLAN